MEEKDIMTPQVDTLFEKVSMLIDQARKQVKTAVNLSMVYTYYGIGQYIVEDEQQGIIGRPMGNVFWNPSPID